MMRAKIMNATRTAYPKADFDLIKDATLGKTYKLNIVIVSPEYMRRLNLTYRNKNHATDILSFPLFKNEGEIYLCQKAAREKAKKFGLSYQKYFTRLFIHGCAHLKGFDHGDKMDVFEAKLMRKLNSKR